MYYNVLFPLLDICVLENAQILGMDISSVPVSIYSINAIWVLNCLACLDYYYYYYYVGKKNHVKRVIHNEYKCEKKLPIRKYVN